MILRLRPRDVLVGIIIDETIAGKNLPKLLGVKSTAGPRNSSQVT